MKKLPTRVPRKKWRRQGNHFSHLFLLAIVGKIHPVKILTSERVLNGPFLTRV